MSRFYKKIFALACLTAISAANLPAQPVVTAATNAVSAAPAATAGTLATQAPAEETAGPMVPMGAPTLFHIGSVPITNTIVWSWGVVLVIVLVVQAGMRRMSADKVPAGLQNILETLVEGWDELSGMILEPKVSRWVFPYAVTFFIFALIGNFVDLMPGVGAIGYGSQAKAGETFASLPHAIAEVTTPFIRPPTSDANLTFVMATIFLVMTFVWAIRYNGVDRLHQARFRRESGFLQMAVSAAAADVHVRRRHGIVLHCVRPSAGAGRSSLWQHFCRRNAAGHDDVRQSRSLSACWLSLPFYFFEMFVAVVQAFVFAMLTIVFAGTLCTHADEEHGH